MTEKIYDINPYLTEFEAQIISCSRISDKDINLVLSGTAFFPEEGGQTCDRGEIDGFQVIDVQIEKDVITHTLRCNKDYRPGQTVKGKIDFSHRYSNMQNHTGEHIYTGLAHKLYGAENVGFHLSDNTVTLDLNVKLTESQVKELERLANDVIAANKKIKCYYPDVSELEKIPYRSKSRIAGAVRIVEIEDTDFCACCAPHVATTAEVGIFKVVGFMNYKGGVRVEILCGKRAEVYIKNQEKLIEEIKSLMRCGSSEIPKALASLLQQKQTLTYELNQQKLNSLLKEIENIPKEKENVIIFTGISDSRALREAVNSMMEEHAGICGVFSGDDENGYSFNLGSRTADCKEIGDRLKKALNAGCGGSAQMITGKVSAAENQIEEILCPQ